MPLPTELKTPPVTKMYFTIPFPPVMAYPFRWELITHELDIDASAMVVSRGAVGTELPDEFVEDTWATVMSEGFQDILSLSDEEILEYANPASGICWYCANAECRWKPKS